MAMSVPVFEDPGAITIQRADYFENYAGRFLSVEAFSALHTLTTGPTMAMAWRTETGSYGSATTMGKFNDTMNSANTYMYHRTLVRIGTAASISDPNRPIPAFVRVADAVGNLQERSVSEWTGQGLPPRVDEYQFAFPFTMEGGYKDPVQVYEKINDLADEFGPDRLAALRWLGDQPSITAVEDLLAILRKRPESAQIQQEQALALRESLPDAQQLEVAESLFDLGWLLQDIGDYPQAESHLRRAIEIQRRHPPAALDLASSLIVLGWTFMDQHNPQAAEWEWGSSEVIRWKAKDGLEIEGILVKPLNYQAGQRYPLMVHVHGGPEAADMNGFHFTYSDWAYLMSARGYAVLLPNYRGSIGRGVKYALGDQGDMGGKEFQDIMDGIDHLIEKGIVDGNRLGIGGWSYGGYMTAYALTHSKTFKIGISGAPVQIGEIMILFIQNVLWDYLKITWKVTVKGL